MRIFWWQAGIHIKPESDEENIFLEKCYDFLQSIKFDDGHPPPTHKTHRSGLSARMFEDKVRGEQVTTGAVVSVQTNDK